MPAPVPALRAVASDFVNDARREPANSIWPKVKDMRADAASPTGCRSHSPRAVRPNLNCVKFSTGKLMWSSKERLNPTTLILAGDKLVFLGREGNLVIAEASSASYKEVARAKVMDGPCWSLPAFSGRRIFCRNEKGDLVCVSVK